MQHLLAPGNSPHLLHRLAQTGRAAVSHRVVCFLAMLCTMAWAVEPARLAVLSSGQSGWGDLLMARLSESTAVALVERDDLGKALDEISLKKVLVDRTKRSRFGKIAGADFLAMLSVDGKIARLVVCDTQLGVILQDQSIGMADQPQVKVLAALANTALQTIQSFTGGVKQVVAVPNFICRDLVFDFTYLQSDYAEVLRSAYRQIPGVAVVAIEEANAIAAERDVAGLGQKGRIVSVFIEGEYRTQRDLQSGGVSVEITLRARDSAKVLLERKLPSVAPIQAGRELMSVFAKDLAGLATPGGTKINEDAQYRLLIERAEEFSMLGEFQRSAALREAALLLKPEADEQRVRLVREYTRHNSSPYEFHAWPQGAKFDERNALWVAATTRAVSDWKRSLQHCEYLVLNRRLSREEATDLTYHAIHSITGVRAGSSDRLGDCEALKKDFLRHVFSRIASLDAASPEVRGKLTGALDAYHFLFDSALMRCDGNFYKADDLDLIADLLINELPDSMWPSYNLNFFLRDTAMSLTRGQEKVDRFTLAEYHAFLDRLMASDRPLVRVYGRYGKLCLCRGASQKSPALLEEAQAVVNDAKSVGFDLREYDYFMDQLEFEVITLKGALTKDVTHTVPVPRPETPSQVPTPKSRISLEPIALRLVNSRQEGKSLAPGTQWNSRDGGGGVTNFRPLAAGLDALWGRGAVFFMSRPGELVQVLADEKLSVADVVCDGRYVWVASFYDWGLSVLDRNGRELTRIRQEDGLPPCNHYGLVVHPIGPGRVLVAGSFGNENRGWIAMVRFDGSKSKVEVIHEATKVWDYNDRDDFYSMDPAKTFSPVAVIEHVVPGPKPRRIVMILGRRGQPLMVDPESLKVQVYPGNLPCLV